MYRGTFSPVPVPRPLPPAPRERAALGQCQGFRLHVLCLFDLSILFFRR